MSGRTALEIADRLDGVLRWPILLDAASALRQQHAEIERLASINMSLVEKSNAYVIVNARQAEEIERLNADKETLVHNANQAFDAMQGQQEEIERLTAERDTAIAAAVADEREACALLSDYAERHSGGSTAFAFGCLSEEIRARATP